MGQVYVQVVLTNYREEVLARLGQLPAERVHRYETEALIDTGAFQSVLPPAVAERLGLWLMLGFRVLCDQQLNERMKQRFASLSSVVHKLEKTTFHPI